MSLPSADAGREAADDRQSVAPRRLTLRLRGADIADVAWIRAVVRSRFFFPVLLLVAAFAVYLPRLDYPERYLFDEVLFTYTAGEYVAGNPDAYRWDHLCSVGMNDERCAEANPEVVRFNRVGKYEWTHPPLGKLFIGAGIALFGNDPVGWRIPSVVVGALGLVIAYQLGLILTGHKSVGLLAAGLLLLDGLYFAYSRLGLIDIYLTVLTLAMLLAFARYLTAPPDRARGPLLWMGMLMGLSIATKWSAAYGILLFGPVILWRLGGLWRERRGPDLSADVRTGLRQHLIWVPVGLVVIPLVAYVLTYLPFFLAGGNSLREFVELQQAMVTYHTTYGSDADSGSRWWSWPLDLRAVWFGRRDLADGRVANTFALGNPFLYWAFLPAVGWTALRWWRERRHAALIVLLIGFFGWWLPWAFVGRSTYLYHFLPTVPFGCLAVAATVVHLYRTFPDWRRTLAIEYVVLVALAFAFFYPIVSFYPITEHSLEMRLWLSSWR